MTTRIITAIAALAFLCSTGCKTKPAPPAKAKTAHGTKQKPYADNKLNGGPISITYSYLGSGLTGKMQVIYSSTADQAYTSTWQKKLHSGGNYGTAIAVGAAPVTTNASSTFIDYDVQVNPPTGHTFSNPVLVRVYPNYTSVMAIHYQ